MPSLGLAKSMRKNKRFSIGGAWDDVTSFVSNNAASAGKWLGGVVAGQIVKIPIQKGASAAWNWIKSVPGDVVNNAGTATNDIKTAVTNPGQAIDDAGTFLKTTSPEDPAIDGLETAAEAAAARLRRRDGTVCNSVLDCVGAGFASFRTIDGLASLWHGIVGNIYAFGSEVESKLESLSKTLLSAKLFAGTNVTNQYFDNSFVADSRGRILHGYQDEMDTHGVSRLRLSDVNTVPKNSMLLQMVPAKDPDGGPSKLYTIDYKGNGYFPITCAYNNTLPKLFIGADFGVGPALLANGTMQNLMPNWCATIPWTASTAEPAGSDPDLDYPSESSG